MHRSPNSDTARHQLASQASTAELACVRAHQADGRIFDNQFTTRVQNDVSVNLVLAISPLDTFANMDILANHDRLGGRHAAKLFASARLPDQERGGRQPQTRQPDHAFHEFLPFVTHTLRSKKIRLTVYCGECRRVDHDWIATITFPLEPGALLARFGVPVPMSSPGSAVCKRMAFLPLSNLLNSRHAVLTSSPCAIMPKKTRKNQESSTSVGIRTRLPGDLEERLRVIWRRLGHLIDWCDSSEAWTKTFCSEVRPYRATFYWEAVAEMVSDHMLDHPTDSPDDIHTDCLVATQFSASLDDREELASFREMWREILCSSRKEIEAFIQSDLELAMQERTYEEVARLYAADYGKWKMGEETEV